MSNSSSTTAPARHRWDIHLKPGEDDKMRPQLVQAIAKGLRAASVTLKHERGGRLLPVHGLYHLHLEGKSWAFRLFPYCHLRWLWRITVGTPTRDGHGLHNGKEFTLLDEEITEQTGTALAGLIRSLQNSGTPVWPMFDHDPSFPRYAWSTAGTERHEDWRRWNEARLETGTAETTGRRAA